MWYAVSLLYKSTHIPTERKPTIWEESIVLVQAGSETEARDRAERIGKSGTRTYEVEGGLVIWNLEQIERVYAINDDEIHSGSEVFSRFLRDSEVASLLTPFDDE
jgi:hypothetical protein